jgi:hypothetical protein
MKKCFLTLSFLVICLTSSCSIPDKDSGYWKQRIDIKAWGLNATSVAYGTVINIGYVSYGRNTDKRDDSQPNIPDFPEIKPDTTGGGIHSLK